jgi:hypothetical protein|tara:strand:- start:436 stop:561 length:126 start_codon:yes stop_codon:yes gene_type:complete
MLIKNIKEVSNSLIGNRTFEETFTLSKVSFVAPVECDNKQL